MLKSKYTQRLLGLTGILLAGGIIFYIFNPEKHLFFPPCIFHWLTGLDCPLCGMQRAIHHLLHFRLKEAFANNPLFVCAIPYIVLGVYIEIFGGKERYPRIKQVLYKKNAVIVVSAIVILFWIGRNLI
ncbi:DUF2752 domain-containing protein [Dysgonomonas sp. 511]|nr:DUF2752 domain-containing protein [Dysgonomonas sp. 511]